MDSPIFITEHGQSGFLHRTDSDVQVASASSNVAEVSTQTQMAHMPADSIVEALPVPVNVAELPDATVVVQGANRSQITRSESPARADAPKKAKAKLYRPHDLRTYGHIPGIKVGATWANRMECCRYGVHAPPVKGIHGSKESGAYSIVISGKYEDDIDKGTTFTYTGTGGRSKSHNRGKLSERLPQKFDQS